MSSRGTRAAGLVALLLGATAALFADQASPQQTPAFRTAANVIAVEASVYDKAGKPVTDLTTADFQIVEDGQPVAPQTIYLVSSDLNILKNSPIPPAATGVIVRRELRPRVLVFVFDLTHLSADGYKRGRKAVESFLQDNLTSSDLIGIVAGGEVLNNKIDANKGALLKAMATMKGPNLSRYNELRSFPRFIEEAEAVEVARGTRETFDRVFNRACTEQPSECGDMLREQIELKARQIASETQRDSAQTLATMQAISTNLGRLPGSKNVVVLSDGFFTGEMTQTLKNLVTLAARNDVRFSTLDARGLGRDPRTQNFMADGPLTSGDGSPVSLDYNSDVLSSLAIDTGGEFLMNRNDLRPSIDIVAMQAGTYYVLGYAPTRQMDGKYHGITVKVSRPDVTVRARKGYVAVDGVK